MLSMFDVVLKGVSWQRRRRRRRLAKCMNFSYFLLHVKLKLFFNPALHILCSLRVNYLGIGGMPPGPGALPSKICFCWLFCISSIWARSVSKMIGANRTIELVKKIQDDAQKNLYNVKTLLPDKSTTVSVRLRTGSGNISVKPHNRS